MDTPITPHTVRTVYAGRIFTVQVESITLPKGHALDAEIVRHPGSVVIVPVTEAGEVILVRQYRHALGRSAWELPAGSLKPGEDVKAAALRECHEEIGSVATTLEPLGAFYPTPGYCDEKMNFFLATGLRAPGEHDAEVHQDDDEDIETKAFTRDVLHSMITTGDIIDLKTIAGLSLSSRAVDE
jgi:ADP-ribose pyrophosphatase